VYEKGANRALRALEVLGVVEEEVVEVGTREQRVDLERNLVRVRPGWRLAVSVGRRDLIGEEVEELMSQLRPVLERLVREPATYLLTTGTKASP
jgi:hypothetical protein